MAASIADARGQPDFSEHNDGAKYLGHGVVGAEIQEGTNIGQIWLDLRMSVKSHNNWCHLVEKYSKCDLTKLGIDLRL